jgi:proteasome accessory factor C
MPKKEVTSEERFNLAISLVTLLLNQKLTDLPIDQAAAHFEVPTKLLREIVRTMNEAEDLSKFASFFYIDVDELEDRGVLRLVEARALTQLPRLTMHQTTALATGLDYLANLPNFKNDPELDSLKEALVGSTVAKIQQPSAIDYRLEALQQAIGAGVRVSCMYVNQSGSSRQRQIQPLRIDFITSKYYLRGICDDSDMLKSFRLDRISEIELLEQKIEPKSTGIQIPDEVYGDNPGNLAVEVRVAPQAREFLWGYPLQKQTSVDSTGELTATIITGNFHTLGRQVLKYGGAVTVLAPEQARLAVYAYAKAVLDELHDNVMEG